jgi:hypothetical protein
MPVVQREGRQSGRVADGRVAIGQRIVTYLERANKPKKEERKFKNLY